MKAITVKYEIDEITKLISLKLDLVNAPEKEKDNLDFFYKEIGCRMIDAVYFRGFDIFVDDNSLLISSNVVLEYEYDDFKVPLAGNLVVTKGADKQGKTIWFDEQKDAKLIDDIRKMIISAKILGLTK